MGNTNGYFLLDILDDTISNPFKFFKDCDDEGKNRYFFIGNSIIMGISNPFNNGSTIIVVPRLLIKNPAIPNHLKVVLSEATNAWASNGCEAGGLA